MSDTFLRIIPTDPMFVPSMEAQTAGSACLRKALPKAERIELCVKNEIAFIDTGENFESVFCQLCGSKLDQAWWSEAMARAWETKFTRLAVTLPCCGGDSNLNKLHYEMPQGFARFVLEAANPNADQFPDELIEQLGKLLGCQVRAIWTRY